MPGFITRFETPAPVKFKENSCDTEFEVIVSGALYINEYKEGTFGETQNDAFVKLKEMAAAKVTERLAGWHEDDKILLVDGKDQLAICLDDYLKELDINGSSRIDDLKITDAFSDAYQKQIMDPLAERKKAARQKAIEDAEEPHGPLREFSYSLSSNGMMAGTSSHSTRRVTWKDDGLVIYSYNYSGGGQTFTREYKVTSEAASKVISLVEDKNIAAIAKLDFELPQVYDNFTSAVIGMVFDDSSLGGDPFNHVTLNCGASKMTYRSLEEEVSALLEEVETTGECFKNDISNMPGFAIGMINNREMNNIPKNQTPPVQLMGLVQADPDAGKDVSTPPEWTCQCGATNHGKFCSACGTPKPEGAWTCTCGMENSGKFCSNCGQARP